MEKIDERILHKGNWLILKERDYKSLHDGTVRHWEMVQRTTPDSPDDGASTKKAQVVVILAIIQNRDNSIILVKQFRAPLNNACIEMPAGLIDQGEDAQEAAVRELREETGFDVELVENESMPLVNDPGITDCSMQVVKLTVKDEPDESKRRVKMAQDDQALIETLFVPLKKLKVFLDNQLQQGISVDSRLYHFALGFNLCN